MSKKHYQLPFVLLFASTGVSFAFISIALPDDACQLLCFQSAKLARKGATLPMVPFTGFNNHGATDKELRYGGAGA